MAPPVWVLSVDLQTRTATFTSGMGEAAKAARSSFGDIKNSAREMGNEVGTSTRMMGGHMMEARHGVMMLGEEFGVHLPRGITTFIASLGPVGAAMEAAFPFLAIILGATLLIEHLVKVSDAAEKAAEAERKMTDGFTTGLIDAQLEVVKAEIEIRKLSGDPAWDLLAQKLQLQDARKGYENVSHLEGKVKELLETAHASSNWNPFNWFDNSGDVALQVKTLREQMDGKNQTDQAEVLQNALSIQSKILEQMKGQDSTSSAALANQSKYVDFLKEETALIQTQAYAASEADKASQGKDRADRLKKYEEDEAKKAAAQQAGFDKRQKIETEYSAKQKSARDKAIHEKEQDAHLQLEANEAVAKELLDLEKERARVTEGLGKEEAEHELKMAALKMAAGESVTNNAVKLRRSHDAQIMQAELAAEATEYAAQMKAYSMELAALDKYGKDYQTKKKAIENREEERTKAHENKVTQIRTRSETERSQRILAANRHMNDEIARSAAETLMRHQSMAQALTGLGDQIATSMIQTALKSIMANDMTKFSDAAFAARQGFKAGTHFPFPANIIMPEVWPRLTSPRSWRLKAVALCRAWGAGTSCPPCSRRGRV